MCVFWQEYEEMHEASLPPSDRPFGNGPPDDPPQNTIASTTPVFSDGQGLRH